VSYTLSELWLYPVKSLGGVRVTEARVTPRGFDGDRRFLLIDADARFLTQRELPELVWFQPELAGDTLRLTDRRGGCAPLAVPRYPSPTADRLPVQIWADTVEAQRVDDAADAWFSAALDRPVRLVYLPDDSHRRVDPDYARTPADETSFADGYPVLLIGQASLDALNARLDESLEMRRFRPNLVVTGSAPHEEDGWAEFRLGPALFYSVKPCGRCVVTTLDPDTGTPHPRREPLRSLAGYRTRNRKILFGQNLLIGSDGGTVRVGDALTVVRQHPPEPAA
jgi:uncharacterized protein YcbX